MKHTTRQTVVGVMNLFWLCTMAPRREAVGESWPRSLSTNTDTIRFHLQRQTKLWVTSCHRSTMEETPPHVYHRSSAHVCHYLGRGLLCSELAAHTPSCTSGANLAFLVFQLKQRLWAHLVDVLVFNSWAAVKMLCFSAEAKEPRASTSWNQTCLLWCERELNESGSVRFECGAI